MEVSAGHAVVTGAGIVAVTAAWYLVRKRTFSIWRTMGVTMVVLGIVSIATGRIRSASRIEIVPAVALGLGSGLALYILTVMFFRVARGWVALHRQTHDLYERRQDTSLLETFGVGALLVSSGEELFWRGLVQDLAAAAAGSVQGALLSWALYAAVNVASWSLPIVLGAVVGGAAWGALAWWSGGVAASLACHVSWTALMIARPPT
jgi:membrane protease YdiL (CAAX protease family)